MPLLIITWFYVPLPPLDNQFYGAFLIALPIELITVVLYIKALKASPLSLTLPFLAITPVALIIASYAVLGEEVSGRRGHIPYRRRKLCVEYRTDEGGNLGAVKGYSQRERFSADDLCCGIVQYHFLIREDGDRAFLASLLRCHLLYSAYDILHADRFVESTQRLEALPMEKEFSLPRPLRSVLRDHGHNSDDRHASYERRIHDFSEAGQSSRRRCLWVPLLQGRVHEGKVYRGTPHVYGLCSGRGSLRRNRPNEGVTNVRDFRRLSVTVRGRSSPIVVLRRKHSAHILSKRASRSNDDLLLPIYSMLSNKSALSKVLQYVYASLLIAI